MTLVLLSVLLIPLICGAQSNLAGLGKYRLTITTPDSLDRSEFNELDQAYVKGTIALPCTHIRAFKAAKTMVDGTAINNLLLLFYDNRLFKISCNFSDALRRAFIKQYGQGRSEAKSRFTFCAQNSDKIMVIWGEVWQNVNTQALAVHANGYNADCQTEETNTLLISDQHIADLASDCELPSLNPFVDEFDKMVNGR